MKRWQTHSFRNRLLLSFLVASLVPMLICSALLSQISRIGMEDQSRADAQAQTEHMIQTLDWIPQTLSDVAWDLDRSGVLPRAFGEDRREDTLVNNALFLATGEARDAAEFSLYDLQGRLRYSTRRISREETLSVHWGVLYAAAQAGGQPVYVVSQDPQDSTLPALQGAVTLTDGTGTDRGYLVMDLYARDFETLLSGKYGTQNDILLLSRFWWPVYASQTQMLTQLAPELRQNLLSGGTLGAGDEEFLYSVTWHPGTGMYLVLRQPQMFTRRTLKLFYTASLSCALVGILISVALCLPLSRRVSQPIRWLLQGFSRLERDDLDVHIREDREDELGQLAGEFNHMVSALKANRAELVKNERELNEAQVRMLQAQLNPHFLCNTLDTMKWISKIHNVPQVALMSTNLADILRFCISAEEFVPLSREVEVLQRYVEIQKIRLSDHVSFRVSLPEELADCLIPKMILQPIVENAILHGLEGVENCSIAVEVDSDDTVLHITITDNGRGLPPQMIGRPYRRETAPQGHHLGLYNVDTILKKHYGDGFGLYLDKNPQGRGARITATLPLRRKENGEC